ncbi:MAG: short-chain dehydrogenase [Ignavibacteria bacterium]|nr:short-chain dehydrogenase [Ignavibacteria bacterium]
MDLKNKKVLILGGWGLVGAATARRIVEGKPKQIILTSLFEHEAKDICAELSKEFKNNRLFEPWWGNIFVRCEFKDMNRDDYLNDIKKRRLVIHDIVDNLDEKMLSESCIYQILKKYKPDVIIDCINTATAIAYQNIYKSYNDLLKITKSKDNDYGKLLDSVEKLICTSYTPQLIRHVQILYNSMLKFNTLVYLKVGTSGTGGMGLNIPFTHSEEKPSRVLLSKSSIAGAHTLLLFLMARTPDGPSIKEIKPTASIAWKRIEYGEIKKRNQPIKIYEIKLNDKAKLEKTFKRISDKKYKPTGNLKTVFIDTGENGIFSRGEFETISTLGQMEFVTPEEIAEDIMRELKGGNTGHEVIGALDMTVMEPSYRAGFMQHRAVKKIKELEKKYKTDSVAFEMLGPPRLSKLLYEAQMIKLVYGNFNDFIKDTTKNHAIKMFEFIKNDSRLRNEMVSIGVPILFPDGKEYIRGPEVKIPAESEGDEINITKAKIDGWAQDGWLDLRESNWKLWKERFKSIMAQSEMMTESSYSSRFVFNNDYWNNFKDINIGKVVGWIFINEEKGLRMKG